LENVEVEYEESHRIKNILFVCYGGGHVAMLLPLILKALSDPCFNVSVLGLTTAGAVLERNGIEYIGFKDLVDGSDQLALEYGEELAVPLLGSGSVSRDETVAYLGLSYYDLVTRKGEDKAKAEYKNKGRKAFLPLSIMKRIFDSFQPRILVSTNSPRAERAAFMVARELKIPSVCIVDLFAQRGAEWIGESAFGSRVCVLSEDVKQIMQSAGRYDHEVVVTGNPALDRLARTSLLDEALKFRLKKGWQDKKVILWASQPEPEEHPSTGVKADSSLPRRVDQALLNIVSRHSEWLLVIRHHPSEMVNPNDWPEQAYISTTQDDLAVLLKSVDVVVTMTSTVGLEGLMLSKPLITIEQSVYCDYLSYAQKGMARGVTDLDNLDDLESALIETLSGEWQSKVALPEVGLATARIYKIIEELLV